jgi:hypothetical protein
MVVQEVVAQEVAVVREEPAQVQKDQMGDVTGFVIFPSSRNQG